MNKNIQSALVFGIYFLFRLVAFPLLVLYFAYRCLRDRHYLSTFTERLGGIRDPLKPTPAAGIWLHAVSVGEVISSVSLLQELRAQNPHGAIFVSVATLTGRKVAEEKLASLADHIFFAPIDYPFAVRRVLRRYRPAVLVVMETEIWPSLYREVKRCGCGLLVVNGRISNKAFPRYRRLRFLFRSILTLPDLIAVQSEQDAERYRQLGAPADRVQVPGNLKYDATLSSAQPPRLVMDLIAALRPSAVVIAASTMPPAAAGDADEDDAVIAAFSQLSQPGLLLILVPRKPERFDAAAAKLRAAGIPFLRRSSNQIDTALQLPCVLLLDTMGELASLFPLADVVFMGGTLAQRGGHNILEPALCRRAIIVGPHMDNFAAIASDFRARQALVEIGGPAELAPAIQRLLDQPALRQELGLRGAALVKESQGATARLAAEILKAQDKAVPVWSRPGPTRPLLWFISQIWMRSSLRAQRRGRLLAGRLNAPVISVGGLAMGGTGKTPLVDYLARRLRSKGRHPAILTRGYSRQSIDDALVIPAGLGAESWRTGDEAQIFVRSAAAHVGIGSDRYAVGKLLEKELSPDVFLLDDGFQHWRLQRQLDIVLVDALNPFAGDAVFPLGMLREPVNALRRAGAVVITRAQPGRDYAGIKARIREVNPDVPIFFSYVEPGSWINERTGASLALPPSPAVAFCGLGNPASFWATLSLLDIKPQFCWAFDDHHRYLRTELRALALQAKGAGAKALLTTEKDAMNILECALEIIAPLDLYWLKIGTRFQDEQAFLQLIEQTVSTR